MVTIERQRLVQISASGVQFPTQPPGGSQQKVSDQELLRIADALGQAEKLFAELQGACGFSRPQGEVSHDSQRCGRSGLSLSAGCSASS